MPEPAQAWWEEGGDSSLEQALRFPACLRLTSQATVIAGLAAWGREGPECCSCHPPVSPPSPLVLFRVAASPLQASRVCVVPHYPLLSGFHPDQDGCWPEREALLSAGGSRWLGLPRLLLSWLPSQKCTALGHLCFLLTRREPGKQCEKQLCLRILAETAARNLCPVLPHLFFSFRSRDWCRGS